MTEKENEVTLVFGNLLLPAGSDGSSIIRVKDDPKVYEDVLLDLHRLGYMFLYKQ